MITLSKIGNAIRFTFADSQHYLTGDGTIDVPVNSLSLIFDESTFATFKKAASNDIFVSAPLAEFGMTKAELITFYTTNMVGSTGGGGGGGVTSGEVQTMIDNSISGKADESYVETALADKVDVSELEEVELAVAQSINVLAQSVSGKQDTLVAGSGITISGNVISADGGGGGGNASITSVTQAQYEQISGSADPSTLYVISDAPAVDISDYYDKSDVDDLLADKQDVLTAGTGIDITNNIISVTGGGGSVTVDPTFDANSTNPVANSAITRNLTSGDGNISLSGGRYRWEFNSVGGYGTNKGFYLDTINGEPVVRQYNVTRTLQLVETSAITTSLTSSSTDSQVPSAKAVYDAMGGLTLLPISQADYDLLPTKDPNTLYIITNVVNNS